MTAPVLSLLTNKTDPLYNDEKIRHVIDDLLVLKNDPDLVTMTLEDHQRHRFEHDFYNLLHELGILRSSYYATLRLNGYTHPQQFTVDKEVIKVPSEVSVERLHRLYKTYKAY